jgi:Glycosyl transferase family 41
MIVVVLLGSLSSRAAKRKVKQKDARRQQEQSDLRGVKLIQAGRLFTSGELRAALATLDEIIDMYKSANELHLSAVEHMYRGDVYSSIERHADAMLNYRLSARHWKTTGHSGTHTVAEVYSRLGYVCLQLSDDSQYSNNDEQRRYATYLLRSHNFTSTLDRDRNGNVDLRFDDQELDENNSDVFVGFAIEWFHKAIEADQAWEQSEQRLAQGIAAEEDRQRRMVHSTGLDQSRYYLGRAHLRLSRADEAARYALFDDRVRNARLFLLLLDVAAVLDDWALFGRLAAKCDVECVFESDAQRDFFALVRSRADDNWLATMARHRAGVRDAAAQRAAVAQLVRPFFAVRTTQAPWRVAKDRMEKHCELDGDMFESARDEFERWRAFDERGDFEALENAMMEPMSCERMPYYTAADCVFVARLWAERDVRKCGDSCARPLCDAFDSDGGSESAERHALLRVAVISFDIRPHPMLPLVSALCRWYPRDKLDLTLYYDDAFAPELERLAQIGCAAQVSLGSMTPRAAAELIASTSRPHVLLDTSWRTGRGQPLIALHRPARLQVMWGGFPGFAAHPAIDYVVSDAHTLRDDGLGVPSELREPAILIDTWLTSDHASMWPTVLDGADDDALPTRASLELPARSDAIVFVSFAATWRVAGDALRPWCDIVRRVPSSVLWLRKTAAQCEVSLRRYWREQCALADERLIFSPPHESGAHLAALACADIALDPTIYNGGTSSVDALYAELPLVHLDGAKWMQRAGGSALIAADLPELIVDTVDQYIDLAVRLANDTDERERIRRHLRQAKSAFTNATLFHPQQSILRLSQQLIEKNQIL